MTGDVPPGRQCSMCEREAVDPTRHGALCKVHHPEYEARESDETAEDPEPDGGFEAANPGCEAGKPASSPARADADGAVDEERGGDGDDTAEFNQQPGTETGGVLVNSESTPARSALGDALEWFHRQLDRDLPKQCDHDTARDYYRDGRGWDAETIDEKLLGYAPADYKDELVAHLFNQGHGRDAILATGLFGERDDGGLYTTWAGRYVLPYFDTEGRPVFAISRATDPVHPVDWKGNKYDKLQVTRDDVPLEEPIYGLDTVDAGEPVLITEGIADAITAHEAGYPCISPVTTQFKQSDREELLDALNERDVGRVYLLQDAERPASDVDDRDRLTLQQFGDGVKGAVKTAAYLSDHGLAARVADLPRPGLEKVDLDDYLQDWSDDLTPLLASAKPVEQHPAYDEGTARDVALDAAEASDLSRELEASDSDGTHSALFDLDIRDVTGLSWDYRGANPLGHHGDSENYFVLLEEHGVAFDHKYKAAYNALTYLLVDAGERRPDSPNGHLSDAEVFAAWRHAKDEGLLAEDDPIPLRALQHVAHEATEWDGEFVERTTADGDTFNALPTDVYNAALDAVRDAHGLEPGREPLKTRNDGPAGAGGRWPVVECEPPVQDVGTFDAQDRWNHLQTVRYDAALDHDGPVIWADPAGSGKTTNAGLGALRRDRNAAILVDKHEKARELQTDDAFPDDWDPFHLKGGEQKADPVCMDADHADEDCPKHGNTSACPSMCPIYDLPEDHNVRQRYEAVARELGDVKAHLLLGEDLPDHDEDGNCAWCEQFEALEHADHVVGVHEYQVLKTVRDGRDVIVDESPSSLRDETRVDVEGLVRLENALEDYADTRASRSDPTRFTARNLASFVRDVRNALTTPNDDTPLADLEPPTVVWNAYETRDDVAGHYVEREEPSEDWHYAEALAQLKVGFTEMLVSRIRRDEWEGTPLCMDTILTAAAEAGLPSDPVMKAVAVPATLDDCPRCGSHLEAQDGGRCCTSCSWHEGHNTLTSENDEQARAMARLDVEYNSTTALVCEQLPLQRELPSNPLVLDATATPSKVARLYDVDEDDLAVFGDDALGANMRVTQVLDGQYHGSTIRNAVTDEGGSTLPTDEWGSPADKIQNAIDTAGDIHEKPLFVVKKGLKTLFDFPDNAEVLHYHATRGLNRNDCDAVMCIGAPHPDLDDLQREAELLAMGTDTRVGGEEYSTRRGAPNPPVYRKLNYEDERGRGRAVPTKHYSGLVGDLFRETREKELVQAVHRARPLLADETVDVYLLTNVPTDLHVDEVCTFDELAAPLQALLPVRDGALELLEAVNDVVAGHGPDGFRAEQLVDVQDDGTVSKKVKEFHTLAQLSGLDVSERTVRNYIDELEEIGLLQPGEYEQRSGVSYTADLATLKAALSVLSNNAGFKVAAVRRFSALVASADGSMGWLDWAQEVLGLGGDRCQWDPPPSPTG